MIALDGRAALIGGRLCGALSHPPPGRRERRSKTMRQASWLLHIEIPPPPSPPVSTSRPKDRADFEALADTLAALFPDAPALAVVDGPL